MKIKALLPTLKEKKRYIFFRIIFLNDKREFDPNDFLSFLKNFLGEILYAKAGIFLISELAGKEYFVLRVNNKYKDLVLFSTLFYSNKNFILNPVKTFGTIRKVKEYLKKNI